MANIPWYAYLFLAAAALSWLLPKVLKIIKISKHKKYLQAPKGTTLDQGQLRALAIGLINGEQIMSYVDTLNTGMSTKDSVEMLSKYWGITDSASAHQTLRWLDQQGHRCLFDAILPMIQSGNLSGISDVLPEEDPATVKEYAENLTSCIKDLKSDTKFAYSIDNLKKGILGWDAGREVTVARVCYDMGYITEAEAWQYINSCYERSKDQFNSWKEFATSYVIGRGMWSGNTISYTGICSIADDSLTLPDSPWTKIKFK